MVENKKSMMDLSKVNDVYDKMTLFGCKYCLFQNKEMVIDLTMFSSREKLLEHVEKEHWVFTPHQGETQKDAMNRLMIRMDEAKGKCNCPTCTYNMTEFEITEQLLKRGKLVLKNGTTYIQQIDQPMYDFVSPGGREK